MFNNYNGREERREWWSDKAMGGEGARKIGQKKIDPKEKANGVESERSGLFRTKGTDAAARLYEKRLKRVVKVRGGRATRDEAEVERRRG